MKIGIVAANGRVGSLITKEAVNRGHEVTAIVRGENKTKAQNSIIKDARDIEKDDLKDFDVVVTAFGTWDEKTLPLHDVITKKISDALSGTDKKFYLVGGAGSLYTNKEHTEDLSDGKDFPDAFKSVASNMKTAFYNLRKRDDVNWIYLSPAADFQADGEFKDDYVLKGEEFTTNEDGESYISYADYAKAMVDLIESDKYSKVRLSVRAR